MSCGICPGTGNMSVPPYHNYLFDVDGTLLDTGDLVFQSFQYTCRKYGGIEVERSRVISDMGQPLARQIQLYLGQLPEERLAVILGDFRDFQLGIYQTALTAFPGVYETLQTLKQVGRHLAIVTSRKMETAEIYLKACHIFDFFDVVITPEATNQHKPHPEPAIKALKLIGGKPEESLFVGDAYFDIECGYRAGTDTAFVAWSPNDPAAVRPTPTHILDQMSDLVDGKSHTDQPINGCSE